MRRLCSNVVPLASGSIPLACCVGVEAVLVTWCARVVSKETSVAPLWLKRWRDRTSARFCFSFVLWLLDRDPSHARVHAH
eukprot:2577328-Pleurochrysis_carterae.AAC.1